MNKAQCIKMPSFGSNVRNNTTFTLWVFDFFAMCGSTYYIHSFQYEWDHQVKVNTVLKFRKKVPFWLNLLPLQLLFEKKSEKIFDLKWDIFNDVKNRYLLVHSPKAVCNHKLTTKGCLLHNKVFLVLRKETAVF